MIEWFPQKHRAEMGAFIDRDGVLNEHIANGYVLQHDQFRWIPGALDALRRLDRSGRVVIIVSNQSCVNRGLLPTVRLIEIMNRMVLDMRSASIPCYGWVACPHRPEEGCSCRKPGTAMLHRSAQMVGVDLTKSVLFGDSASDIEAAARAGATGVLVDRNRAGALGLAVDRMLGHSA